MLPAANPITVLTSEKVISFWKCFDYRSGFFSVVGWQTAIFSNVGYFLENSGQPKNSNKSFQKARRQFLAVGHLSSLSIICPRQTYYSRPLIDLTHEILSLSFKIIFRRLLALKRNIEHSNIFFLSMPCRSNII